MSSKRIVQIAALSGLLAVVLGAFGAHGLKAHVSGYDLENWKTAVSYQFYHTLALLFLAVRQQPNKGNKYSVIAFIMGIILFSGSLYLLATRSLTGISSAVLGPITPIGGLAFIVGWLSLFISYTKDK